MIQNLFRNSKKSSSAALNTAFSGITLPPCILFAVKLRYTNDPKLQT